MKKSIVIKILAVIVIITSFFSTSAGSTESFTLAQGNVAVKTLDEITYFMQRGASVRTVADSSGLRFTALISKSEYDALRANPDYEQVVFGMIIMPYDYEVLYGQANYENVFGKNAVYAFEENTNKIRVVHLTGRDLCPFAYDDNYMAFNGVIINIFESNYCRKFVGRGYVAVTTEKGVEYKFACGESDARSVTYVAGRAIADGGYYGDELGVLQGYLQKSSNTKTSYMVKTYLNSVEDASRTKSFETTVGAEISVVPESIDGYEIDLERSVLQSFALANDCSALELYYESTATQNLTDEVRYTFDLSEQTFTLDAKRYYGEITEINGVSVIEENGKVNLDKSALLAASKASGSGDYVWKIKTQKKTYRVKATLADKVIRSAVDLNVINENPNGYYVLDNDVFVNGEFEVTAEFNGILDGGEHKISDIAVASGKGVFNSVGANGVIKNVSLVNVDSGKVCLSAAMNGLLKNVFVSSGNAQMVINNVAGNADGLVCFLPNGNYVFNKYSSTAIADNVYAVIGQPKGNDEQFIGICNTKKSANGLSTVVCQRTQKDFLSVLNDPTSIGNGWSGDGKSYLAFGNSYVFTA